MKKHKLLSILLTLPMLFSCSSAPSYYGEYSFQLGKDKGSHLGISMTLTDEAYLEKEEKLGEKFHLKIDSSMSNDNSKNEEEKNKLERKNDSTTDLLKSLIGNNMDMQGYYSFGGKTKDYTVLNLGLLILTDEDSYFDIPSVVVEKILYATYTNQMINVYIPVSIDDLLFQLYWYGFDINLSALINSENFEIGQEVVSHDIGTHPTSEEIEEINKTYSDTHMGMVFRDFHTMSMRLSKK